MVWNMKQDVIYPEYLIHGMCIFVLIRGGPLVLPDHPALVEEVLTKLGYLADGDLTEAVLAFCNRSANKSN